MPATGSVDKQAVDIFVCGCRRAHVYVLFNMTTQDIMSLTINAESLVLGYRYVQQVMELNEIEPTVDFRLTGH